MPGERSDQLPPLVALATSGLSATTAAPPLTVLHGETCGSHEREIVSIDPELYARLCAACEVEPSRQGMPSYKAQKVLCLTYAEHHRGRNRRKKEINMGVAKGGELCADLTADTGYQVLPLCKGDDCYCRAKGLAGAAEDQHYKKFKLSKYTSREMDRTLADTFGQVLAPAASNNCSPTVQTEYSSKDGGGHGRGWEQTTTYGAKTTWRDILADVPDYGGLTPCGLPWAARAASGQQATAADTTGSNNSWAGSPDQEHSATQPASTGPSYSVAAQAQCMVCQTAEGCGCWAADPGSSTTAGYCEVHGPCNEQLGQYYAYYFGDSGGASQSGWNSGTSEGTQRIPTGESVPDHSSTGRETAGTPGAAACATSASCANNAESTLQVSSGHDGDSGTTKLSCDGRDVCNGLDDDCDLSTVDGSDDERLFEPCRLAVEGPDPVPEAARLVSSSPGAEGTLICRAGELVCVEADESARFEAVVAAHAVTTGNASGCPGLARISAGQASGAGWVLALLLLLRFGGGRRRRARRPAEVSCERRGAPPGEPTTRRQRSYLRA